MINTDHIVCIKLLDYVVTTYRVTLSNNKDFEVILANSKQVIESLLADSTVTKPSQASK